MRLYLSENLRKAAPPDGGSGPSVSTTQPTAATSPKPKTGGSTIEYDYWGKQGSPPAGSGWEQSPSGSWRRPKGAGGATPSAEGADSAAATTPDKPVAPATTPEAPDASAVTPKDSTASGGYSTDPEDYSKDSKAIDHYRLAHQHGKTGYADGVEGHKKLARDRSKDFTHEDHTQLAAELRDHGMPEDAAYHDKLAEKQRATEQPKEKPSEEAAQAGGDSKAGGQKKQGPKKPGKEAKPKAAEEEKPVHPASDLDHAKVAHHKNSATKVLENIKTHLDSEDLEDADREKLQRLASELENHVTLRTLPMKEQTKALSEATKLAGEHGKSPAEENPEPSPVEAEEQAKARRSRKPATVNLGNLFESGRAAGQSAGRAAAHDETAGSITDTIISYGSQGALRSGHHLLHGRGADESRSDQPPRDSKSKKDNLKSSGSDTEQSSMAEKSMPLYLDLVKAVNAPNVGTVTETESRARIRSVSSYAKRPTGVASGEEHEPDEPEVGRKWKHSDEESVNEEVESLLKEESEKEKTSSNSVAKSLIKSLNDSLHQQIKSVTPSQLESQFMVEELGYDASTVKKGLVCISGRNRHAFNEWAHTRLNKSLSFLAGRFS
jgi:hypothetical protein